MSSGDFVKINNSRSAEKMIPFLLKRIESWDYAEPLVIRFEKYEDPRSLNQSALFHIWCREMSKAFSDKVPDATPDGVKAMMKMKFLGTHTIKVGKTVIPDQLKSTASLKKGEFVFFLDQVYDFAANHNVFLTLPAGNEYTELKRLQEK